MGLSMEPVTAAGRVPTLQPGHLHHHTQHPTPHLQPLGATGKWSHSTGPEDGTRSLHENLPALKFPPATVQEVGKR
jgi:hypothetical protein